MLLKADLDITEELLSLVRGLLFKVGGKHLLELHRHEAGLLLLIGFCFSFLLGGCSIVDTGPL